MDPLPPIPTPPAQRWREFRIQALPVLTFIAVLVCVVVMWDRYVIPANIIGEVESVRINVISTVPGTLRELKVTRFQRVSKGEEIAQITTMDPDVFQAELRAIEADLRLLRARMQLDVERNVQNYELARLEFLKERVDVDIEEVEARFYESEAERQRRLLTNITTGAYGTFTNSIVSMTEYETSARLAQSARTNVVQRGKYLAEKEATLPRLVPATQADDLIAASIAAQEEKLRATQQTISLKSPIDGMVSVVNFVSGAKVYQNQPIITVSAMQSSRIIGWVKKPFSTVPKPGDVIQIRRQSFKREVAQGTVIEVSAQLEPISPTLVAQTASVRITELGLPFTVSLPPELNLIPGESVDLILMSK